ncbi:MAG: RNA polymerase sigma factor [Halioglobus sp.]|nr:RNA polymerase sigma factor [Halioglobus sp.]
MARTLLDDLQAQHARNFGWSLACCGWQRDLAEDVLQEAYLRVLEERAVFSGRSSATTWFFAVIKRVASETRRARQRRAILNLRAVRMAGHVEDAAAAAEGDAADSALRDETAAALRAALLQLSRRQREVLHLVFYNELTLEEAAVTLRISLGSARTHYHRGKLRLAQLLNLERDDESDT